MCRHRECIMRRRDIIRPVRITTDDRAGGIRMADMIRMTRTGIITNQEFSMQVG